ncbi:MAG: hypothetical protein KC912_01495 [Proteobacteria bacterium]|nr:hypothetical protein [Pseudomonadota bacterium]
MQVQLKIRTLRPREAADDDSVGTQLVAAVQSAVRKGGAPTVALTVRDERIDLFRTVEIDNAYMPVDVFLAGLSRSEAPGGGLHCVGVMGTFTRRDRPGVRQVMVFLEWEDCRWWLWRGLLDAEGALLEDTESVLRAVDGDTKPMRIGGWWSLGRRRGMQGRLDAHSRQTVH